MTNHGDPIRSASSAVAGGTAMARELRNSGAVEALARGGLATRGLSYLIVASIAIQIAVGKAAQSADQNGAIQDVAARPFGKVALAALAIGFAAYALWRLLAAVVGSPADRGKTALKKAGRRLGALATGLVYAGLCYTAIHALAGGPASSSTRQQQSTTAWLLGLPLGRVLVIGAGVAVVVAGCALIWWGASRRFERNLETERMGPGARSWAAGLGVAGFGGGGVAAGLVGIFLVKAGIAINPDASKGLDQTLRAVAAAPFGKVLVAAIAAGLAAYGLYSFFEARYRRV